MSSDDTKISEFNKYEKFDKTPSIVYADLESLNEWINNNHGKISTTKVCEHIPSGFSMPSILPFKDIEDKHNGYRSKGYMKKFCECLKKHARKIINFKKKNMKLLTNEQQESYESAKIFYICKEKFEKKYAKYRSIIKL